MDEISVLRTAIDGILESDRVTREDDGTYTVRGDNGVMVVGRTAKDWAVFFPGDPAHLVPYAPRAERPHELVVWVLL